MKDRSRAPGRCHGSLAGLCAVLSVTATFVGGAADCVAGRAPARSEARGRAPSPKTRTDSKIAAALGSRREADSSTAALQVFERGERMIPLLLRLKGDKRRFTGLNLGGRNPSDFYWEPAEDSDGLGPRDFECHVVSVEVAALYLIEAIYRRDMRFADEPFLTERSTGVSSNLPEFVASAWLAVEHWEVLRQRSGIEGLRRAGHAPLLGACCEFETATGGFEVVVPWKTHGVLPWHVETRAAAPRWLVRQPSEGGRAWPTIRPR